MEDQANKENWNFQKSKIVYNLNFVYQSGLVEFLIEYFNNPKAIILFGSYSIGEDIESSDIDIVILSKVKKEIEFSAIEGILQRKINSMIISDINQLDKNIKNKVMNGITLYGAV